MYMLVSSRLWMRCAPLKFSRCMHARKKNKKFAGWVLTCPDNALLLIV